jgi:tetratricopeptide (TPR) repeat protein
MSPKRIGLFSLTFLLIFAFLLILAAASPAQQTSTPITQKELLSWVIGGMTEEHLLAALNHRGLKNNSPALVDAANAAGATDAVMAYLRKSKPPTAEDTSATFVALAKAAKSLQSKDDERAFNHLHEAALADKENPDIMFAAAGVLRRAEAWEQSADAYRVVTQLVPSFVDGWQGRSYTVHRLGDDESAAEFARRAISLDPNDSDSHKFLGLALEVLGNRDGALKEYGEALRLNPRNAAVYYDRGILRDKAEQHDAAIEDYKKSLEIDPNQYERWYNLGVSYADKDDFVNAIAAYRRSKSLNPDFLEARQNLGAAYCTLQRHAEAISEFRELLKIEPAWNMARECLAKSLAATNDLKGAVEVGEQSLRYEPQDEKMLQRVIGWYWMLDRMPETEPLFDRMLAVEEQKHGSDSKEYGYALSQRALLYFREKKYSQADSDYKQGLKLMRASGSDYQPIADAVQRNYDAMLAAWHGTPANTAVSVAKNHSPDTSSPMVGGHSPLAVWRSQLQAANAAMNQRKYPEAAALFDTAVVAAGKIEPANEELTQTLEQYSGLYMRQKDFPKAEELMLRALSTTRKNMGVGSQFETGPLDALGNLYLFESKCSEAIATFTKALDLQKKWLGPRDPGVGLAMDHLANAYSCSAQFEKAQPLLEQYLKMTEEFYGADAFNVSVPLDHLGALYIHEKEYDKAEVVYRRNLGIYEKKFGQDSPMLNGTLYALADSLRQLGRPDEAKAFDERREALAKK